MDFVPIGSPSPGSINCELPWPLYYRDSFDCHICWGRAHRYSRHNRVAGGVDHFHVIAIIGSEIDPGWEQANGYGRHDSVAGCVDHFHVVEIRVSNIGTSELIPGD